MRIAMGVEVGAILSVLRGQFEHIIDADICVVVGNTDTLILRLSNRTDQIATWGVDMVSNGHNLHASVCWGGGELIQGRPGAIRFDHSGVLMPATATGLQTNVRIFPNMWIEIRIPVTWVAIDTEPAVQLVPEIAGLAVWSMSKDPTGMATTAVLPGP